MKPPDPSDTPVGARLALENAERHLRCAEILASKDEFGPAISHVVLAGEEAVKGSHLASCGLYMLGDEFGFSKILHRHGAKHEVAAVIGIMSWVSAELLRRIPEILSQHADPTSEEYTSASKNMFSEVGKMGSNFASGRPPDNPLNTAINFWKRANDMKNAGLYVDYINGSWRSPSNIGQEEFSKSFQTGKAAVQAARKIAETNLDLIMKFDAVDVSLRRNLGDRLRSSLRGLQVLVEGGSKKG
jgi:AbiV family abortive infection protein